MESQTHVYFGKLGAEFIGGASGERLHVRRAAYGADLLKDLGGRITDLARQGGDDGSQ